MNRRLRRMMREIERRGGKLYVNPQLPDDLTEQFLTEVLACPECGAGVLDAFRPRDGATADPERRGNGRHDGH